MKFMTKAKIWVNRFKNMTSSRILAVYTLAVCTFDIYYIMCVDWIINVIILNIISYLVKYIKKKYIHILLYFINFAI
jgi:hypothetical protein